MSHVFVAQAKNINVVVVLYIKKDKIATKAKVIKLLFYYLLKIEHQN